MDKIGFDNSKYLALQSEKIAERIKMFGDKLYLEFGGKLFDDFHASRVLPGFLADSKIKMLLELKDDVEVLIVINSNDIESNKSRSDIGIHKYEKYIYVALLLNPPPREEDLPSLRSKLSML